MRGPSPKYRAQGIECNVKTPGTTGTTGVNGIPKSLGWKSAHLIVAEARDEFFARRICRGGWRRCRTLQRGGMVRSMKEAITPTISVQDRQSHKRHCRYAIRSPIRRARAVSR